MKKGGGAPISYKIAISCGRACILRGMGHCRVPTQRPSAHHGKPLQTAQKQGISTTKPRCANIPPQAESYRALISPARGPYSLSPPTSPAAATGGGKSGRLHPSPGPKTPRPLPPRPNIGPPRPPLPASITPRSPPLPLPAITCSPLPMGLGPISPRPPPLPGLWKPRGPAISARGGGGWPSVITGPFLQGIRCSGGVCASTGGPLRLSVSPILLSEHSKASVGRFAI